MTGLDDDSAVAYGDKATGTNHTLPTGDMSDTFNER